MNALRRGEDGVVAQYDPGRAADFNAVIDLQVSAHIIPAVEGIVDSVFEVRCRGLLRAAVPVQVGHRRAFFGKLRGHDDIGRGHRQARGGNTRPVISRVSDVRSLRFSPVRRIGQLRQDIALLRADGQMERGIPEKAAFSLRQCHRAVGNGVVDGDGELGFIPRTGHDQLALIIGFLNRGIVGIAQGVKGSGKDVGGVPGAAFAGRQEQVIGIIGTVGHVHQVVLPIVQAHQVPHVRSRAFRIDQITGHKDAIIGIAEF